MSNTFPLFERQIIFFSRTSFALRLWGVLSVAFLLGGPVSGLSGQTVEPPAATAATPIPTVPRELLRTIDDDSPLNRPAERAAWDALFRILRRYSEAEIESAPSEPVGFVELNRQPVEYRGRLVRITGSCKRCIFRPQREEPGPFDDLAEETPATENVDAPETAEAANSSGSAISALKGYYEAWVIVADRKDVPICVCLLDVPDDFPLGEQIDEPVTVTGFFYKRQLFLSSEDEEVVTPTLLAKSLRWDPAPALEPITLKRHPEWALYLSVGAVVLCWFFFRLWQRGVFGGIVARSGGRDPIRFDLGAAAKRREEEDFDGVIRIPGYEGKESKEPVGEKTAMIVDEKTTIIPPEDTSRRSPLDPDRLVGWLAPLLFCLALGGSAILEAAEASKPTVDAEYVKEFLLEMDEFEWATLGDPNIPWEHQRDPVVTMLNRLRGEIPDSFLKANISYRFPAAGSGGLPFSVLVRDPAQFRGKVFELRGDVIRVDEIFLDPKERGELHIPFIYRCRFLVGGTDPAEILTAFVPDAWRRGEPIRERAALTGIYIKRLFTDENAEVARKLTPEESVDVSEIGASEIFNDTANLMPLLLATKIRWYPDTFLGNIGMDIGAFDGIPAFKLTDLKEKELKVPQSLSLLTRNQVLVRAFRITEHDYDAFYGLLQAASATPAGLIEQEARKILQTEGKDRTSAVDLFNHPDRMRGQPVLLTGTAKRVLRLLVDDPEVHALYGIDHYYEIQLFTKDSQRNPITVCVTSLPEGMPTGSAADYNELITVAAFPYKLWIYESSEELEDGGGNKPNYAPLLVGREPLWKPKESLSRPGGGLPDSVKTALSVGIFFVLLLVWFFFRTLKRPNSTITFDLKKNDKKN